MSQAPEATPEGLMALHDAAHAGLDALFFRSLEHLTALDIDAAARVFDVLGTTIETHAAAEEQAFDGVLTDDAEPPRGASPRIFMPEHRQLEGLVAAARTTLVTFVADPTDLGTLRATIVRGLEPLFRVHHLLSHHHQREERLIYPFVAPRLPSERLAALMNTLAATLATTQTALISHPAPR
jgi:DNA-binding NtrC family response regulator